MHRKVRSSCHAKRFREVEIVYSGSWVHRISLLVFFKYFMLVMNLSISTCRYMCFALIFFAID